MATSNPAFRNAAFGAPGAVATSKVLSDNDLNALYNAPSAGSQDTDRMTYEDTIRKSVLAFGVMLTAAAASWVITPFVPFVFILGAIVGLVLGLVNAFKKEPSAPLILAYAGFQGLFVGGISRVFESSPGGAGVVSQAVIATLVVVGVTLALFRSGKIRASKKATKVFLIAMIGYAVFSLVNIGMMMFGAVDGGFGMRSASIGILGFDIKLGLVIGVLAVLMAAYSLVLDFDFIQKGVNNRAPRKYGWTGAFGIMVTVVWLYVELLRIFMIARE